MQNHRQINRLAIRYYFCIAFLLSNFCLAQGNNFYFTCSYETPHWGTNVIFLKIDLDSKQIVNSFSIPISGQIIIKKPVTFISGRDTSYFINTVNGQAAKNSEADTQVVTNYAILNNQGDIFRIGQISNFYIFDILSNAADSSIVRYNYYEGGAERKFKGILRINRDKMPNTIPREPGQNDSPPDSIGTFSEFHRIDSNNNEYYWCLNERGVYLLALDVPHLTLNDSLNIDHDFRHANLLALSSVDSTIFSFSINYNIMNGPLSLQKRDVYPSYLIRYKMDQLEILDSVPISNPPDSDYVMAEYGICNKVGPYFVYFFFSGEDYRYFSPAMLFIFDTRTNEATWLRVGWR